MNYFVCDVCSQKKEGPETVHAIEAFRNGKKVFICLACRDERVNERERIIEAMGFKRKERKNESVKAYGQT